MLCKNCNKELAENAVICPQCGVQTENVKPQAPVPTHLVQAIVVTVLCCLPLGIPAIVYAAQVNSKLAGGDYEGAVKASKNANMWSWIAFGAGLLSLVLWILFVVLGAVAGANGGH